MASPQQEEYLRRRAEEEQRKQMKVAQRDALRKKKETGDYIAQHWRAWARYSIFTLAGLLALYYSWVYIWPLLFPYDPGPMEQLTIEEVAAEFRDDPEEAEKKYENKRIVVEGRLVKLKEKNGSLFPYLELRGEKGEDAMVRCEFYDIDESGSIQPGDGVRLSGVVQRAGPGKIKLIGAATE